MTLPPKLEQGSRVALICPASPVPDEKNLANSIAAVEALGFVPVVYESCLLSSRRGYLAATDEIRARDVMRAFLDNSISGVFALRGGYGCERILPVLALGALSRHPKFFAGYSDITALHIVLNQQCKFVTYHAIMPSSDYAGDVDKYSMDMLKRCIAANLQGVIENPETPFKTLFSGYKGNVPASASGVLTGGNLSLVARSLGTPWEIDTRGKLLFLEDVGEAPYRIDGMLTQLRNAGKLTFAAGLLLGYFTEMNIDEAHPEKTLTLDEIFNELLPRNVPTVTGVCCGHKTPTLALPLGAMAKLEDGKLTVEMS